MVFHYPTQLHRRRHGPQGYVDCRSFKPWLLETLSDSESETAKSLLQFYFGFPVNLPDLSKLNPPGGNSRPDGIAASYYELRSQRQLPENC